jgi:hypothetical protein
MERRASDAWALADSGREREERRARATLSEQSVGPLTRGPQPVAGERERERERERGEAQGRVGRPGKNKRSGSSPDEQETF